MFHQNCMEAGRSSSQLSFGGPKERRIIPDDSRIKFTEWNDKNDHECDDDDSEDDDDKDNNDEDEDEDDSIHEIVNFSEVSNVNSCK
jgi:hypothetical protein